MTPWAVAYEVPLSMGFPRQEYWSGLSFPSPGDLPDPDIEPMSSDWQAGSLPLSHQESPPETIHTCKMFPRMIDFSTYKIVCKVYSSYCLEDLTV